MKLRLRGDSLRLRLTRSEVAALAAGACVEESVRLGPGEDQRLRYRLRPAAAGAVGARLDGSLIEVVVPAALAKAWAESQELGLEARQGSLRLLIEKDLACLTARRGEDDSDAFPNPKTRC